MKRKSSPSSRRIHREQMKRQRGQVKREKVEAKWEDSPAALEEHTLDIAGYHALIYRAPSSSAALPWVWLVRKGHKKPISRGREPDVALAKHRAERAIREDIAERAIRKDNKGATDDAVDTR